MSLHGIGDRWLAGGEINGVSFHQHDEVELITGMHAGRSGRVLLLMDLEPEPRYLIRVPGLEKELVVRQSSLRPTAP